MVTVDDSKTKVHKSQPKPGEESKAMNESGFTYNPKSSKDHEASMLSIHYLSKGKSPQIQVGGLKSEKQSELSLLSQANPGMRDLTVPPLALMKLIQNSKRE